MEKDSTTNLLNILKDAGKEDIVAFRREHLMNDSSFPAYMDTLISLRQLKRQDIFQKADLPQKYGYKLLTGETHTTDRDKLLRIFIAMGLNLKETQRALTLNGLAPLYAKNKRDVVIIIALNKSISSVDTVNEWLSENGEEELNRSAY
jgi:hypothetical protein